jgi:ABC-type transporter Mla maintaining outer membrane lipid asymmetry ATPase subunit MlaF
MAEAVALGDRIGVMDEGQLIWSGPSSALSESDDPRVRRFVETLIVPAALEAAESE